MAVSPQTLRKNFSSEVDAFEKILDSILIERKLNLGNNISIPAPENMTYSHFQEIKTRYERVGWSSLSWHSDQRDGETITFVYK
jgi:hypothetical protein